MSGENNGGMKRRDFLKVLGVVGGTAAVSTSCSEPVEQIIPYVIPPENVVPGIPPPFLHVRPLPTGNTTMKDEAGEIQKMVEKLREQELEAEQHLTSPNLVAAAETAKR